MYIRIFITRASVVFKTFNSSFSKFYLSNEKYILIYSIVYSDTKTLFGFQRINALFHLFKEFRRPSYFDRILLYNPSIVQVDLLLLLVLVCCIPLQRYCKKCSCFQFTYCQPYEKISLNHSIYQYTHSSRFLTHKLQENIFLFS